VAFSAGPCNTSNHAIVVFSQQTNRFEEVASGGNNIDPDWGADGWIYFVNGAKTGGDLYAVNPQNRELRALGLVGRQPTLSPDRQYLAYMARAGNEWRVYVVEMPSAGKPTSPVELAFPAHVPDGVHARMPNWANDSRRVVFNITDRNMNSVALASVDIHTGELVVTGLDSPGGILARPACSRAENQCITNGRDRGLYLVTLADGRFSDPRQITNSQDWGAAIYP
jgi:Tol biopolymer transport system component